MEKRWYAIIATALALLVLAPTALPIMAAEERPTTDAVAAVRALVLDAPRMATVNERVTMTVTERGTNGDVAKDAGVWAFTREGAQTLWQELYAPKSVGALFVRGGVMIDPIIHGAGQEHSRRAGTENVPYVVALGAACDLVRHSLPDYETKARLLRDRLYDKLVEGLGRDRVSLNGHPEKRLPNTLNVSIRGVEGEELLRRVPEVAASTGSDCHSVSNEPSRVLVEMGVSWELALGALRLSLGCRTTGAEIDLVAGLLVERVERRSIAV